MIAPTVAVASPFKQGGGNGRRCERCGKSGTVQEAAFVTLDGGESVNSLLCPQCLRLVKSVLLTALEPTVLH